MASKSRAGGVPQTRVPAKRRPRCSAGHKSLPVQTPTGWVCPECFNEHVQKKRDDRTSGGVVIPAGVKMPADNYFGQAFPNRAARRRALRR